MRIIAFAATMLLAAGCAGPQPTLAPSAKLQEVGPEQAQRDVLECMSLADRRLGLKCHSCGESLSMGSHVRRLRRCGGACPKCGTLVVDPAENAEPGAPPNGGPAMRLGNSGATGGPPSVS